MADEEHAKDPIVAAIEGAEEVRDQFDELVESTKTDPGAPFTPDWIDRIGALARENPAAWERLRRRLKEVGCRVPQLDRKIENYCDDAGDDDGAKRKQADVLIELADTAELFRTPDSTGYADVVVNDHRETWAIRSKGFRRWLTKQYFDTTKGAPNSEALQAAINVLEAKAQFGSRECPVHVRVGGCDGRIYIDLADKDWRVIEVSANGWQVISAPSVRFRRAAGMKPLPEPVRGGSIEALRRLINVKTQAAFVLVVGFILACLRDRGPYPLLILAGEAGSAKSSFVLVIRSLVDPNTAPLRALSREDRELFIAATNSHLLCFDNVSGLQAWISDTLCRLATGGGFAVRQLYSDGDEKLFDASRPAVLNGIEDIVTRTDLADRSIFLMLEPISEDRRRTDEELVQQIEADRPGILGVLLDAMVEGLRRLPHTKLDRLPRMADFARWAVACETALWPAGAFMAAYSANCAAAVESVIDADPVAAATYTMMAKTTEWSGTATALLEALEKEAGDRAAKAKEWPSGPRSLSGRLRRAAPFLRKVGINFVFDERKGRQRNRTIAITSTIRPEPLEKPGTRPSAPSVDETADGAKSHLAASTIHANPLKTNAVTDADAADAKTSAQSGLAGAAENPALPERVEKRRTPPVEPRVREAL